jgi:hypothetical protein
METTAAYIQGCTVFALAVTDFQHKALNHFCGNYIHLIHKSMSWNSDAQPVSRGTPVCRRGHLGVPRNFHLSL